MLYTLFTYVVFRQRSSVLIEPRSAVSSIPKRNLRNAAFNNDFATAKILVDGGADIEERDEVCCGCGLDHVCTG